MLNIDDEQIVFHPLRNHSFEGCDLFGLSIVDDVFAVSVCKAYYDGGNRTSFATKSKRGTFIVGANCG